MIKRIIAFLSALVFACEAFSFSAFGMSKEDGQKFLKIWRSGDEEALTEFLESHYFLGDGSPGFGIQSPETAEAFRNEENQLIVAKHIFDREELLRGPYGKYFLDYEKTESYANTFGKFGFTALTEDGTIHGGKTLDSTKRGVYTLKEILRGFGIDDPKQIGMIYWGDYGCEYGYTECSELTDYIPGWNEIEGDRYYIKSDGTVLTQSMTIGGIRWKFGENGVCQGKYTGFTKSSKGRRYWKNGILQKNRTVTLKNGTVYTADEKGYLTVV